MKITWIHKLVLLVTKSDLRYERLSKQLLPNTWPLTLFQLEADCVGRSEK